MPTAACWGRRRCPRPATSSRLPGRGETILLFGDGFGLPSTALTEGSAAQTGSLPSVPRITIGGQEAAVTYAGVVSPGLYQFNVIVPDSVAAGNNPVICTYANAGTPAGSVIAVER